MYKTQKCMGLTDKSKYNTTNRHKDKTLTVEFMKQGDGVQIQEKSKVQRSVNKCTLTTKGIEAKQAIYTTARIVTKHTFKDKSAANHKSTKK